MASMALSPSAAALFRSRHDRLSAARRIAMVLVAGLCACGPACTSARADDTAPATRPAKDPAEAMLKVDRAHLQPVDATKLAIVADPGTPRPPYAFSAEDSAFLDEVHNARAEGFFSFESIADSFTHCFAAPVYQEDPSWIGWTVSSWRFGALPA